MKSLKRNMYRLILLIFMTSVSFLPRPAFCETLENLRAQDFKVRVEIVRSYWNIKAVFSGPFIIKDHTGRTFSSYTTGKNLKISAVESEPRETIYHIALETFPYSEEKEARNFAAAAVKKTSLGTKTIRPLKPKQLIVIAGEFRSLNEARSRLSVIKSLYPDATIRKHLETPKGKIEIRDGEGNLLGTFNQYVSLLPRKENARTIMCGIKYRWKDWKEVHPVERTFRGAFEIRFNKYGKLIAINILQVDHYLYGILPLEMGDFAPLEALKALAVAGRSEALAKVNSVHHNNDPFDFCNEMHCQVYHGALYEDERCNRAVEETKGIVLMNNGRIIDAIYSHSCGGITADSEDLWRDSNEPYFLGRLDTEGPVRMPDLSNVVDLAQFLHSSPNTFCNPDQSGFPHYAKKYFRWTKSYSITELSRIVNSYYNVGKITDIIVTGRGKSGRVKGALVRGERGSMHLNTEQRIRVGLGRLYSTFFYMEKEKAGDGALKRVKFTGGGFGHGVGLCQMGAFMMAKRGYTYREILNHYFHDVDLHIIY